MARGRGKPRWIFTRYRCYCAGCGGMLPVGTAAFYVPSTRAVYGDEGCCVAAREQGELSEPRHEDRELDRDAYGDIDDLHRSYGTRVAY